MRAVLSSVFVLFLSAGFALAQAISIDEINRYLNGLKTAEGEFTQINADGTISTGQIYIHRPGRIRFEYNPPEETLVMAGGGQLAIFDGRAAGNPDQYPLKQTPLNLILARNIDLSRNEMIVGYREEGPATVVVAQDPDRPELGTIE